MSLTFINPASSLVFGYGFQAANPAKCTTKSDVMKSTFTAVLWFYDDEKLGERRSEILEEIRRGLAPAKKPRAPKPANDLDQANARIVE